MSLYMYDYCKLGEHNHATVVLHWEINGKFYNDISTEEHKGPKDHF